MVSLRNYCSAKLPRGFPIPGQGHSIRWAGGEAFPQNFNLRTRVRLSDLELEISSMAAGFGGPQEASGVGGVLDQQEGCHDDGQEIVCLILLLLLLLLRALLLVLGDVLNR